jgi:hypothetical protein
MFSGMNKDTPEKVKMKMKLNKKYLSIYLRVATYLPIDLWQKLSKTKIK